MFGISEMAIILIVVILLLGAKKLPDLARSAGKAARILKSETRAMKADGTPDQQATYQVTENRPHQDPAAQPDSQRPEASPGHTPGNTCP
ncbi:Sec-independent protein translocase subunit TatA [Streptomyces narbonensis]|uniref:Sec-independent protein translocase subunit TatA n=1 Tax=Streptomyces narbonensis TaxID=67333 RepID=UPI00167908A5|nr:Sec-independent protein translocase subunit TatA [Streptomyces narbonensis]GGW08393.1 Sec-independent protein translocase protein TatA [Streptomyces narbonensis]